MAPAQKYHLHVTAGHSYDPSTHTEVPVNTDTATMISGVHADIDLHVRIQNYRGLPAHSPETCEYFQTAPHNSSRDLYSIAFSFKPKSDIPGDELLFGNDFEKSIKDHLPTGFGTALKFVQWAVDPGLSGDVYADKPYLYGPLLSSINVLRIGNKKYVRSFSDEEGGVLHEGADGDEAKEIRSKAGMPDESAKRMKHFLNKDKRNHFTFEQDREYACDFFNPYLDFNELALKLPVVTLPLMRFWDGQPLRYVLKRKSEDGSKDDVLFVVLFTLIPAEEAIKEAEGSSTGKNSTDNQKSGATVDDDGVD